MFMLPELLMLFSGEFFAVLKKRDNWTEMTIIYSVVPVL
jgi:tRNA nucleotidyltransferase (CCA-adding enzyme)